MILGLGIVGGLLIGFLMGWWVTRRRVAKAMLVKSLYEQRRWALLRTAPRAARRRAMREQWGDSGLKHG